MPDDPPWRELSRWRWGKITPEPGLDVGRDKPLQPLGEDPDPKAAIVDVTPGKAKVDGRR
jgi:hypothetical protein